MDPIFATLRLHSICYIGRDPRGWDERLVVPLVFSAPPGWEYAPSPGVLRPVPPE